MNNKKLMLAALLACAFAPAVADEDMGGEPERRVERRIVAHDGKQIELEAGGEQAMFFPGMRMHHNKVVKGAPYSAEFMSERVQNLADGNQISHKTSGMSYRDGAGRTRHEMRNAEGELRTVTIRDAGEGSTWLLNPRTKTATKIGVFNTEIARAAGEQARAAGEHARVAGERARIRIEQLRKEGKLPALERNGERVIVKRIERAEGEAGMRVREDVRVRVAAAAAGEAGAAAGREMAVHLGPVLAGAFDSMKWAANATTRDLGTRDMEGVKATGKMRSYEIPAGAVGNRNAIVVSDETWYAPDLQVTVYAKHSDPRSGEVLYKMDHVKREEPAAALFSVPSDYKVNDVMAHVRKRIEKKAE